MNGELLMSQHVSLSYPARRELVAQMAPRYREASLARKGLMLDSLVEMTGYARKYAIGLLNQETQGPPTIRRPRQSRYGFEVQQALCVAWRATRYICAKRLIPFLPELLPYLERKGRVQLNAEQRGQLLAMSSATAERFLRTQRKPAPRGLSTTKAGTWLKHQIPIRTFAGWEDAQPGFLEADLVAHCGGHTQGSYLYTLTLTDVATGWTECLPLLARTSDLVLTALERARTLFPFPILGIDTDNGAEFINADVVAYCEREHLTFTRGRPNQKNDQCYVEEKNRSVVRHVVGHDRLVGEQAYQQLGELYRALRLYVNCFQPCMKLLSKTSGEEDNRVCRVYDPAKTPLQRLLLSGVLPASAKLELENIVQALDPLDLVDQLEHLQNAVFRCAVPSASFSSSSSSTSPLRFVVEQCFSEPQPVISAESDPAAHAQSPHENAHTRPSFLNWRRSSTNPFASEWERILAWVNTHPAQNTRDLFVELQQVFPGRYQASQYSALQRAVRKIRAHLRKRAEEPWPIEIIHGWGSSPVPEQGSPKASSQEDTALSAASSSSLFSSQAPVDVPSFPCPVAAREEEVSDMVIDSDKPDTSSLVESHHREATSSPRASRSPTFSVPTIAPLIQAFLQERRGAGREEKTIEWHQRALRSLQQYLEHQEKDVLEALTTAVVRDWLAGLCSEPSKTGTARSSSTINAYARSARAFCHWLVLQGYLERTPFVKGTVPKATHHLAHILTPEAFEQLLRVCGPSGDLVDHATARNRALLWLFWETGLLVTEVCGLRLWDVDREQGQVRIQGPDAKARWLPVGASGWHALLCYLDHFRLIEAKETAGGEVLFLSERDQPLIPNAITLLFPRLSRRAGMRGKGVSPSLLRDTFAVRYLQQGGHLKTLQKLLGLGGRAALKRYQDAARSLPCCTPTQSAPEEPLS